jgi:hypothetical protein
MEFSGSHSKRNEEFWQYLRDNLREVLQWPTWMRGDVGSREGNAAQQDVDANKEPQCIAAENLHKPEKFAQAAAK